MAEDLKYRQKYNDLKRRIREIEEENDVLNVKLYKARKSIRHLKLERTFLLDRMEKAAPTLDFNSDNSDAASEIYNDSDMYKLHSQHKHKQNTNNNNNKPKKKKDPNAPKGPGNVFFLFCRLERDNLKDTHPTENLKEVTTLLGQKWKSLSKEEKKKYYDLYKRELEEYEEAMKTYTNGTAVATNNSASSPIISSPTQSTEVSVDFPSDPIQPTNEEGSFIDEENNYANTTPDLHVSSAW